jgi:uncharacterized membrane protein
MLGKSYGPRLRTPVSEDELNRLGAQQVAEVVDKNIQELIEWRQKLQESRSGQERVTDAITFFSGTMWFVYLNLVFFAFWIIINQGWFGIQPFDPFPFDLLTTIVSLEAILLSLFILMTQNRMQAESDRRDELDLQINLLTEYELTRVLTLVQALAERMGVEEARDPEIEELKQDVTPQQVVHQMEEREKEHEELKNGELTAAKREGS